MYQDFTFWDCEIQYLFQKNTHEKNAPDTNSATKGNGKKLLIEQPTDATYHLRHIYSLQAWKVPNIAMFQLLNGSQDTYQGPPDSKVCFVIYCMLDSNYFALLSFRFLRCKIINSAYLKELSWELNEISTKNTWHSICIELI